MRRFVLITIFSIWGTAAMLGPRSGWAASQSLGGVTLTTVSPRIMTPNGDSLNDVTFFKFEPDLIGIPVDTAVYDITGAKISDLTLDADGNLQWDGKNDSGNTVPAGIYVYSIKIGKNNATGTVVVAR